MLHNLPQICFLLLIATTTDALADDGEQASFDFGYAMQAAGSCRNLMMRVDTEKKLEGKFGVKLRGPGAPHGDSYLDGLLQAINDEGSGLCENAWDWYGCSGTKHPRLLVESPAYNDSPQICPY